jgi:hypothetical protein
MAYGDDITEAIPYTLSNPAVNSGYSGSTVAYDIAIGGQPFFLETSDESPYRRVTAQYRKQQIDQTREPGEQTLTGWWIRSQSTFHFGQGIKFFEPAQDEGLRFQYTYSKGCDIWSKGQVTLLKNVDSYSNIDYAIDSNGRSNQYTRSIRWSNTDGILLHDKYTIKKVAVNGTVTAFQTNTDPTDAPIFSVCDDGVYAYWVTNSSPTGDLKFYRKLLTDTTSTSPTLMFTGTGITVTSAVIEYTKERIVAAINNKVYEITSTASALPTAVYTHPDTDIVFTSITSSGSAIYLSGFSGIQSNIYKFTLSTAGAMPTLTSAITAAELPVGEKVFRIAYYLGYMAIGTDQGLRIAAVSDADGSIAYGPLIFESEQTVYDVAFRDKYLWCATNVDGNPGVTRIDLGQPLSANLVFAYAWDLYDSALTGFNTTGCAFAGDTDRLMFVTANNGTTDGKIYIQSASTLVENAELRTGFIRYNTLENKIFKTLTPRFDTTNGGIQIYSVQYNDLETLIGNYPQGSSLTQIGIAYPATPQQYLGFRFLFSRSSTDATSGPTFTGYQVNTLPSIPRQRLIQYPAMCYDFEMDKFNNQSGYDGAAYNRMSTLENIEDVGDTVLVQDFRSGESYLGLIEEQDFINKTPTDKRYSGYGGVLLITIRKV